MECARLKCDFFHKPIHRCSIKHAKYVLKLFVLLETVLAELGGVDNFLLGRADLSLFIFTLTNLMENLLNGDLNWRKGFVLGPVCKP